MPNLVNRRRRKSKVNEISSSAIKSNDSTDSDHEFSSKLNFNYHHNHVMTAEKSNKSSRGDEKSSQPKHKQQLEAHKIR